MILQRINNQKGMTLMEMILALGILGSIMGLTTQALHNLLKSRETIDKIASQENAIKIAMDRIVQDFRHAFLVTQSSHNVDNMNIRMKTFFVSKGGFSGAEIYFTAFGHRRIYENEAGSDQRLIHYALESVPGEQDQAIVRGSKFYYENAQNSQNFEEKEKMVLVYGIKEFGVQYFDDSEQANDWVDEWDSTEMGKKNTLPKRFRIKIKTTVNGIEKTYYSGGDIPLGGKALKEEEVFFEGK